MPWACSSVAERFSDKEEVRGSIPLMPTITKLLGAIVESSVPLEINSHKHNKNYLSTKKKRMGHKFKLVK